MPGKLKSGAKAPNFSVVGADGSAITNLTLAAGPYVLIFYPGDDTPTCTNELVDFSNLSEDFTKLNIRLLGISPDSPKSHEKFRAKWNLQVELASDEDAKTIRAFSAWGEKALFGRRYFGVLRTSVLIAKGRIAGLWRVTRVAGHAAAVLQAAAALGTN